MLPWTPPLCCTGHVCCPRHLDFAALYQSEGGKAQRPNGVYDSWVSVRVGGWSGHQHRRADQEIIILNILVILQSAPFVFFIFIFFHGIAWRTIGQ